MLKSKNLDEANENAEQFLEAAVFSENPVVSVWRKAYQKFKTKKGLEVRLKICLNE